MSEKTYYIKISMTSENIEKKEYKCNEKDCLKDFTNEHSLKKHILLIHHNITSEKSTKIVYQYNCPVESCRRHKDEQEFFTSRKYLIQHVYKSHNSERFVCEKGCEKKFSTEMLKTVHEKSCGKIFTCESCNCSYSSNEALITHRKRKNHIDPSLEIKSKKTKIQKLISSVGTNTTSNLVTKSTTTDDCYLTKGTSIKSISTSTNDDFTKEENSNSLSSSSSQNKKTNVSWSGEFEEDSITLFDSAETQTDFTESLFSSNFMNNFTQTTFADFDDFEKFDIQTQTEF